MGSRALRWLAIIGFNLLLAGFLLEAGTRGWLAREIGPAALAYGTDSWRARKAHADAAAVRAAHEAGSEDVAVHGHDVGGYRPYAADGEASYSKYPPGEAKTLRSAVTGARLQARINAQGFRGADFAPVKPPGVARVVVLGASSTFGYGVADDETYPAQLERLLNAGATDGHRFEVLNFGIPHSTAANLVALFRAEGLPLHPDLVLFYEGANDAAIEEDPEAAGPVRSWLRDHLLAFALAEHLVESTWPPMTTWSEAYAERRTEAFLKSLDALASDCESRGIPLLLVTQQTRSLALERDEIRARDLRYADEVAAVQAFLGRPLSNGRLPAEVWREASGRVRAATTGVLASPVSSDAATLASVTRFAALDKARVFLLHARLMAALRDFAEQRRIPVVDGIAALDGHREELFSWVHLTPEGNRLLAEALAREILAQPPKAARQTADLPSR